MLGVSIISLIVLLGVLIFVHEIGHFLAAKYCGVKVLKFSLGFGPKLIGRKWGETEYLVSVFPLGGYVKLLGESEMEEMADEDRRRCFAAQSVWRRIAIVAAGPLFNFLLAIVIFAIIYMAGLPVLSAKLGGIQEGSPAAVAGLAAGDVVTRIDGRDITRWDDLAQIISRSAGAEMKMEIRRNQEVLVKTVRPVPHKSETIFGEEIEVFKIGVMASQETFVERLNPAAALWGGIKHTWIITKMTCLSIYKMIEGVISPKNLGGPILIAQLAGKQAQEGLIPFLFFMALLSINLGVLNLLPIPVLDGGHIMFFLIEIIKGRPVKPKWRELAQSVGFVVIILLMILVFYFDLTRTQ